MLELTHAARLTENCMLLVGGVESDATAASVELMDGNGNVRLSIQTDETAVDSVEPDVRAVAGDIQTLARQVLAPLGPEARAAALDFLASTIRLVPPAEQDELSEKLFGIREALRERLPLAAASGDDEPAIQVDRIMAVDERSFYVEGSLDDSSLARLTAVSPEGSRCELLERLYRHGPSGARTHPGSSASSGWRHPASGPRAGSWSSRRRAGSPPRLRVPPWSPTHGTCGTRSSTTR